MKTIVKKYGGATLADPERIRLVAKNISECHHKGERLIIVVSAMGNTTNNLIQLAHEVSNHPKRRELDMLLTTGERISMSLLSMALNDLNCPAISFTGSQAGVLTDDSHLNAFITDLNPPRVIEALNHNKIVIIAGFQGVSPLSKEITTLGRGGSDTTAVAIAAALNSSHCEILKDVPGVFSADPKICPKAHLIHKLNYQQMLEMTFWGAKVLHYRSVELAHSRKVKIFIGPVISSNLGTWITNDNDEELNMFESVKIISINSHSEVIPIKIKNSSLAEGLENLQHEFTKNEISFPQLISVESEGDFTHTIYLTGPKEVMTAIKKDLVIYLFETHSLCTVTATCTGASTPEIATLITTALAKNNLSPLRIWMSGMSCTILLTEESKKIAIHLLHDIIDQSVKRT